MIFKNIRKAIFASTSFYQKLSLCCSMASVAIVGHADEVSATDINNQAKPVEEVIVTAFKREQTLHEFAGSISVIKAGDLPLTSTDIANQAPGFSLLETGPRNPTSLVMRGLRFDAVDSNDFGGDGSSVASYVDNIPLQGYFAPPTFSLKDLQQVEVLRGPQGTLYGNASIGGLIRYITAKPDVTKTTVNVFTSLSQTKEASGLNYNSDLVVNLPLIDNTLAGRLLLSKEHNEGFIDDPYLLSGATKNINDDETKQARLSMLWQPTAEFSLGGSYDYQKINVDDRQAANKSFTGDDYTSSNKYLQPMEGKLQLSAIDANYQFEWAKLTASVNRYDYKNHQRADQTDYLITLDTTNQWGYYTSYPDFSAYTTGDVNVEKNSAEVRLVSSNDQPLRWLAGLFYSADDLDATIADTVPGFGAFAGETRPHDLDYYATQAEKLKEHSLYTEIAYDLLPQWEVLIGGRYFEYDDDLQACSLLFPTTVPFTGDNYPVDCLKGKDKQHGTQGKFSTTYKINSEHTAYFTIAEGFRRGGANLLPVEINHNRSYKPDVATNYELGTHSYFLNKQVQVNAAVFYINWKDIQVDGVVTEGWGARLNAQEARSQGAEVETKVQLATDWSIRAAFSYTDAELTKTVMAISGGSENAYAGDTLPGSPAYQWNLGLDYMHQIDGATINASLTFSRNSEMYSALNKEFADYDRYPGYNTANINTSVSMRNWKYGVFVNNISNVRGITGKRTAVLYGEQGQFEYITRPRTMGIFVNYHFE